jgi:hypothetical protein
MFPMVLALVEQPARASALQKNDTCKAFLEYYYSSEPLHEQTPHRRNDTLAFPETRSAHQGYIFTRYVPVDRACILVFRLRVLRNAGLYYHYGHTIQTRSSAEVVRGDPLWSMRPPLPLHARDGCR